MTENTLLAQAMFAEKRTGRWLAKQLGVHHTQISRWVNGRSIPTTGNRRRIAKALGVTVESLWPSEEAS